MWGTIATLLQGIAIALAKHPELITDLQNFLSDWLSNKASGRMRTRAADTTPTALQQAYAQLTAAVAKGSADADKDASDLAAQVLANQTKALCDAAVSDDLKALAQDDEATKAAIAAVEAAINAPLTPPANSPQRPQQPPAATAGKPGQPSRTEEERRAVDDAARQGFHGEQKSPGVSDK